MNFKKKLGKESKDKEIIIKENESIKNELKIIKIELKYLTDYPIPSK